MCVSVFVCVCVYIYIYIYIYINIHVHIQVCCLRVYSSDLARLNSFDRVSIHTLCISHILFVHIQILQKWPGSHTRIITFLVLIYTHRLDL
jgi:hypothetical protein